MESTPLHTKLKNALRIDRALIFVWQASPSYVILSTFIVIVLGLLPLAALYLVKLIIDSITQVAIIPEIQLLDTDFSKPILYIGLACCVGLLTTLFNCLADYISKAQAITVTDYMFGLLHKKSTQTDLSYFESPAYTDILFRAQKEGPYRPTNIVKGLFTFAQNGASFAAIFGLIFIFNPVLSIAMILAAVPGILIRLKYSKKIYTWQEKRTEDERRSYYFHWMLTSDTYAKEFKLFNLGRHFIDRFKSIRHALRHEKLYYEKRRSFGDFIAQSAMTLTVFGSFAYIAYKTVQGTITIGDMVMYIQGFQKGLGFLKNLLESCAQMYEDNLFLSQFYDFLNLKPEINNPKSPKQIPDIFQNGIEFQNVAFSYPGCKKKVIKNINFSVKPGETIAIVGANGSGKSTIVKLLSRLYDPQEGNILLEGQDIKQFNTTDYREKISVVFQDHVKYQLSAKENIFLGNLDKKDDIHQVQHAAIKADVDKKLSSLPSGYETILGRWFKSGEELSIGQWQMVAIARAFFRDAPIVVLDEPSSALDPQTELHIFTKLKQLMKDKSALIISHRFSTVKIADNILVLDKGEIIEQGTHAQLMKTGQTYSKLYTAQADNYK